MFRIYTLCLCLTLASPTVFAIDQIQLSMASLAGANWRAEQLRLSIQLPTSNNRNGTATLTALQLTLPKPIGVLKAAVVQCAALQMTATHWRCTEGSVTAQHSQLGAQPAPLTWSYDLATSAVDWDMRALPVMGGQLNLTGRLDESGIQLSGSTNLTGGNASGTLAADQLRTHFSASLPQSDDGLPFVLSLTADHGQAYIEPIFVDAGLAPLSIRAVGHFESPTLRFSELELQHRGVLSAQGHGRMRFEPTFALEDAEVTVTQAVFPAVYQTWIQPFRTGLLGDALKTKGELRGEAQWTQGRLARIDAQPQQLYLHGAQDAFSIDDLNGELHWRSTTDAPLSQLRWAGGHAYRLPLGASTLKLQLAGVDVQLVEPLHLPMLEGALVVDEFAAKAIGSPDLHLDFDGHLKPIQMAPLCVALGWPVFGGQLSGELPRLTYKKQVLTLGGTLRAQVFDGEVALEKFTLKDPFGRVPRLGANLHARNLDLAQFTQAFSFGKIEGRLNADVEKLRLQNWQPVSFNARLYTPPDDRSRHRISQRAVDHIASIGSGGATAVLSGTMLRFFEDFRYDRLGMSCVMSKGVCDMSGVAPGKNGGYYLVKGAGLPRIDVMGFVSRVQWATLVEQIRTATQGGAPVIK